MYINNNAFLLFLLLFLCFSLWYINNILKHNIFPIVCVECGYGEKKCIILFYMFHVHNLIKEENIKSPHKTEETWSGLKSFAVFMFERKILGENSCSCFLCALFGCWKVSTIRSGKIFNKHTWNMFLYRIKLKFIPMCIRKKPRPFNWIQKQQQQKLKLLLMIVGAFF